MTFPVKPSQVAQFEKQKDISIDIYILHNEKILLFYKSVERKPKQIDLLIIQNLKNFHYVWIKNLSWLLRNFTVSSESFQEKKIGVTQSKNGSEFMEEVRGNILKKLKPEASKETSRQIYDLHSYELRQTKELTSEKKDVSTQTNSADNALLRKMKPKESVRNSKRIFDIPQRAIDSPFKVKNWNFSNEHTDDDQGSSSNHSYISSTDDASLTKYDKIDYEN